jgi:ABC-2 type transport system permease protein
MTTLTLNSRKTVEPDGRNSSILPVLQAEWTKLRSLRSTRWIAIAMLVATIGIGAAITAADGSHFHSLSPGDRATWDPTDESMVGMVFGQLAVVVLAVLAVTGEYSSGTIRSSIAAVPRRTPVLFAKCAVVGGAVLALGEAVAFVSFWLGQAVLSANAPTAAIGDPHVLRAITLAGAYLALIALISIGLGFILRNTAGAIAVMVGLLLVLPAVFQALPMSVQNSVGQFMPEQIAANSMAAVVHQPHALGPVVGTLVLASYAAVALAFGARSLRRRDV